MGLDGATWSVIHALGLPHLGRLAAGGRWGPLGSTTPPMTLPAWSSFLCGVNPGRHGILDFMRRPPGRYGLELLHAGHRLVPTMHELLSARGRRVASLFVPTTWPPSKLNGLVVSGFDNPAATRVERAHVWPPARHEALVRRFGALRYADLPEGRPGPGWEGALTAALLRELGRKEALCAALLREEPWDLFMVVFGESDTAGHHLWRCHDPGSPRHLPGHEGLLASVYRRLDAAVGRLAAEAELVCVVSDHGMGGASDRVVYLNRFLEAGGWLRFAGGAGARGADRARQAALSLPVGGLVRRLPARLTAAAEARTRWGGIDFAATDAWSDELAYAPSIHLSLRGREPLGRRSDREGLLQELEAALLGWEEEGERVVARVHRREAVLEGPAVEGAPDLYLELAAPGGHQLTALPSARVAPGVTGRRLSRAEHGGGKGRGMNGSHRPDGVYLLHGAAFGAAGPRPLGIAELFPVLFDALGEPLPPWLAGQAPPALPPARPYRPAEAAALRGRLARLGYLA